MAERLVPRAGSNGPDRGAFLATVREVVLLEQARESAHAAVRNRMSRAQRDGFELKQLKETIRRRKEDPDKLAHEVAVQAKYDAWAGLPIGAQGDMFRDPPKPAPVDLTDPDTLAEAKFAAEQSGYGAGRAGRDRVKDNTETPGSELHVEWDKGFVRGMTAIAAEMHPPSDVAKAKPGRKRGAGNPEDAPTDDGETVH